jgi:DNA topoisomerase-1
MSLYTETSDNENSQDKDVILPSLSVGQKLGIEKLDPEQHFTEPPPHYSEASLVKMLEEKGIGRPSTYAPTISTIISRGYVTKEKKILFPTELGKIVTHLLEENFTNIMNIDFTADMESKLDNIEEGLSNWKDIIRDFYGPFSTTLSLAEEKIGKVELTYEESNVACEKCGKMMVIKQGKYGKFLACPGFPECRNAKPIIEEAGVNCPVCGGKVLIKKTKRGKKYFACENSNTCKFMIWGNPTKESCKKCGNFMYKKGKDLVCSNPNCSASDNDVKKPSKEKTKK